MPSRTLVALSCSHELLNEDEERDEDRKNLCCQSHLLRRHIHKQRAASYCRSLPYFLTLKVFKGLTWSGRNTTGLRQ